MGPRLWHPAFPLSFPEGEGWGEGACLLYPTHCSLLTSHFSYARALSSAAFSSGWSLAYSSSGTCFLNDSAACRSADTPA